MGKGKQQAAAPAGDVSFFPLLNLQSEANIYGARKVSPKNTVSRSFGECWQTKPNCETKIKTKLSCRLFIAHT